MIKLTVDGKQVEAEEGKSVLHACLANGIFIPNLCFLEEMTDPPGSCRMCFVEIEGEEKPVTSCKVPVREGMVVKTDTEAVRALQRNVFNLLFSAHYMECKNCLSRKSCELQKIAKFLGIRLKAKKLDELGRDLSIQPTHPCFDLLPARCILCHKCLYVCKKAGHSILAVDRKAFDSTIVFCAEDQDPEKIPCPDCGECVKICPVSAIVPKKEEAPKEASA